MLSRCHGAGVPTIAGNLFGRFSPFGLLRAGLGGHISERAGVFELHWMHIWDHGQLQLRSRLGRDLKQPI